MYIHICGLRSLKTYEKGENRMMTISKDQAFELKVWDCIPNHITKSCVCEDITDKRACLRDIRWLIYIANILQQPQPTFYRIGNQWGVEIPAGLNDEDAEGVYKFILGIDKEDEGE